MTTEAKTAAAKKSRKPRKNSKSGAIRAYMKRKPEAGPTEIAKALSKRGLKISAAHVSNVKATLRKSAEANGEAFAASGNGVSASRRGRPRRGRKPAAQDAVSLNSLIEARAFAERVGGVEQARALLAALAKLQG